MENFGIFITITTKLKYRKMIKKRTKIRYYVENIEGERLYEATTIDNLVNQIGCTRAHMYFSKDENNVFKFNKNTYKIIDKLDLV